MLMKKQNGLTLYSPQEFIKAVQDDAVPTECAVVQSCIPEVDTIKAAKGGKPRYRFKISTEAADRDRDIVSVNGWDTANYKKNPVVLFGHDYRGLPIGSSTVKAGKGSLDAEMTFVDADVYPFAETVRRMVEAGVLRAASVGFKPKKYAYNEERRGVDIIEAELLEWSIVPVPANPECLVQLGVLPKNLVDEFAMGCEAFLKAAKGEGRWTVGRDIDAKAIAEAVIADLPAILRSRGLEEKPDKKELHIVTIKKTYPGCTRSGGCPTNEDGTPENCAMADCPMKPKDVPTPVAGSDNNLLAGIEYVEPDAIEDLKIDDEDASLIDATTAEIDDVLRNELRNMVEKDIPQMVRAEIVKAINHARGRVD